MAVRHTPLKKVLFARVPRKLYAAYGARLKLLGLTMKADMVRHMRDVVDHGPGAGVSGIISRGEEVVTVQVRGVPASLHNLYAARLKVAGRSIQQGMIAHMLEIARGRD